MTNLYLEKIAGMKGSLGKVVGVLNGDNIVKAKTTMSRAADKLSHHYGNNSKRFQAHMDALNELGAVKSVNKLFPKEIEDIAPYQVKADITKRPYETSKKALDKVKSIAAGRSLNAEMNRTSKYRANAVAGSVGLGIAGYSGVKMREKKAEMTNKYLEKIAAVTGIELGALAALGGYSADKGDGNGGAVAGIAGGMLGHKYGVHPASYAGVGVAKADHAIRKLRGLPHINAISLQRGLAVGHGVRAGLTVGGAIMAGKAYSKFKHRNDYE